MKLPIIKAVGETFAFLVKNLVDVLRVIWAPFTLLATINALVAPRYLRSFGELQQAAISQNEQQAMQAVGAMLPDFLVLCAISLFVYPVVLAGLLKLILRDERPRLPLYLGFGLEELRIAGTLLLLALLFFGVYVLMQVALAAVGGAGAVGVVVSIGIVGAVLWLALRLSLAAPAAVGAEAIGVRPSWRASNGNTVALLGFWGIWIAIGVGAQLATFFALMPEQVALLAEAPPNPTNEEAATFSRRMVAANIASYDFTNIANLVRFALSSGIGAIVTAIGTIASGVAWRHLSRASA